MNIPGFTADASLYRMRFWSDDSGALFANKEEVKEQGEVIPALGEMECATTTYDELIDQPLLTGDVAINYARTSVNALYDHPGCPRQFVVEVRQTKGRNLWPIARPGSFSYTGKYSCETYRVEVGVYGYKSGGVIGDIFVPPSWTLVGTAKYKGSWSSVDNFSICDLVQDPSYPNNIPPYIGSQYDRIRIATKVYRSFGRGYPQYEKATGGVMSLF